MATLGIAQSNAGLTNAARVSAENATQLWGTVVKRGLLLHLGHIMAETQAVLD